MRQLEDRDISYYIIDVSIVPAKKIIKVIVSSKCPVMIKISNTTKLMSKDKKVTISLII